MRNTFYLLIGLAFFAACSAPTEEYAEEESTAVAEDAIKYNYSGSFEMADEANLQVANDWLDAILNKDADAAAALLADSVSIYTWDGSVFISSRDSIMQLFNGFVNAYTDIQIVKLAGVSVHSTDRNADWGMIWISEKVNRPDGSSESMVFQENFEIEDGKIRSVRQYGQKPSESTDPEGGGTATEGAPEYAYSGSFVLADASLTDIVTGWNNALATPSNFEEAATYLADSVEIFFWDGMHLNASKDSVMAFAKEFINGAANVDVSFDAAIAVTATDRQEDWVLSWTNEKWTDADGEVDQMFIHEDYQIVDNKIALVRQYAVTSAEE